MDLAVLTYGVVKRLPQSERFELGAQIRRAATSIPSNIAEGHATGRTGRFLYHVRIAQGSLGELETDFELAQRLSMLTTEELEEVHLLTARTGQLLHGLTRSLKRKLLTNAVKCLAMIAILPVGYLAAVAWLAD